MTAKAIVQFINRPASELPSLKSRMLKRLFDVVLIGVVSITSILVGTIISTIFLGGVE
jgi:hypothetical protein